MLKPGFTPQYWQMNALIKRFWGENFAIVGFPCNQFGHQEPADNKTELLNSMEFVRPGHGFRANFTLFSKLAVNGDKESPVFTFLKVRCAYILVFTYTHCTLRCVRKLICGLRCVEVVVYGFTHYAHM